MNHQRGEVELGAWLAVSGKLLSEKTTLFKFPMKRVQKGACSERNHKAVADLRLIFSKKGIMIVMRFEREFIYL